MTTTADRPSTRRNNRSVRALGLSVLLLATACGEQEDGGHRTTTPTATAPAGTLSPIEPNSTTSQPGRSPESQDSTVNITISHGKDELAGVLNGVLNDTAVARDFAGLLPLTPDVSDFHSTEKIADLPRKLDTTTAPAGTAAVPGDLTSYARGATSRSSTAMAPTPTVWSDSASSPMERQPPSHSFPTAPRSRSRSPRTDPTTTQPSHRHLR